MKFVKITFLCTALCALSLFTEAVAQEARTVFTKTFNSVAGGNIVNTGVSSDDYFAAISSFHAFGGDINEKGTVNPIRVRVFAQSNTWRLQPDFATHGNNDSWNITILFVKKSLDAVKFGKNGHIVSSLENSGFIADVGTKRRVGLMKFAGTDREGGIWRVANQDFEIGRIGASSLTSSDVGGFTTDLYVGGNGNIGIGTTSPSQKLHIAGNALVAGTSEIFSTNRNALTLKTPDNFGNNGIAFQNAGGSYTWNIHRKAHSNGGGSDADLVFAGGLSTDLTNLASAMTLKQNGDMVLGGRLTANRVTLNVGSFPDYVFADDYELMPLNEVEAFIQQNKHLPNMPGEAEVVENGMDVGQINTILVEKVEELTLHTIEQQKHIQSLEEKLEQLAKQLTELQNK